MNRSGRHESAGLSFGRNTGCRLAQAQFFMKIGQTAVIKYFLPEHGEHRVLTFGRCANQKSFDELYEELRSL